MNKKLCLSAALILCLSALGCTKLESRVEIRDANNAYEHENWAEAMQHYQKARQIDGTSFPELDRMIGYCYIGQFQPDVKTPENEKVADNAINNLKNYLLKRPDDTVARDALINTLLNANRTSQAIDYFKNYLVQKPNDLDSMKSLATLYSKEGNFNEALNWYEKIKLHDANNPEAYYVFGVVCYEKVAKDPPADMAERKSIIEKGKQALQQGINLKPDYFEAMAYLNLLLRQQAVIETDPAKQQDLVKQADAIRLRAMEIVKQKKAANSAK